ncbi:MAG TPA: helix-turn-helix transcriptional regulator, partial [Capillimicrobium sp.]
LRVELEVARALRSAIATAEEGRARIAGLRGRAWDPERPVERLALALTALDDLFAGRPADELARLAERALPAPGALRGAPTSQLLHIPFYVLVYCDRLGRARELLDELIADSEAHGARMGAEIGALWRALAHLRSGALAEAEADARRVITGATQTRWRFGDVAARHFLAEALLERGAVEEARRLTPASDLGGPELPPRGWTTHVRFGRARVALAAGEAQAALDELLEVGRLEAAFAAERPTMLPWRSEAALAAVAVGDGALARRLAAEEVAVARRIGAPRALGVALRASGIAAAAPDAAQEALEEAVAVLAPTGAALEHARALVELGAALRRSGRRRDARERLRAGLDLAVACGGLALADRARAELAASGARLQRERASGVEALTGSELRVARMAAAGASNPEIAQALFVSRKTVEKHLAGAYAKLGIGSRGALADALGDSG